MAGRSYFFRPMRVEDLPLMRAWLDKPHMREWWGEPEEELRFIRDAIEGRDTTRPFIFSANGQPVGYIQYWFIDHYQNAEWIAKHPWLAELPPDAVGVDLSIGEPDKLSQGLGSEFLRVFARFLAEQGHPTIIIDPLAVNRRAVRAYEKAGFRPIPQLLGRTGDTLIMRYEMTETDPIQ
jgi:RimJ/RimL family protein N-acetyltransferase